MTRKHPSLTQSVEASKETRGARLHAFGRPSLGASLSSFDLLLHLRSFRQSLGYLKLWSQADEKEQSHHKCTVAEWTGDADGDHVVNVPGLHNGTRMKKIYRYKIVR